MEYTENEQKLKGKVDEFRENNIGLRKQVEGFESKAMDYENQVKDIQSQMKAMEEKYSGIDLDEWDTMVSERKAMAEKEMIEKGDVDQLLRSRVDEVTNHKAKEMQALKDNYESQLLAMQEDLVNYDSQLNTMLVDNELTKAANKAGVHPEAMDDLVSRGRGVFRVEDHKATAFNKEGRPMYEDDAVTPMTIKSWVGHLNTKAPHLFSGEVKTSKPETPKETKLSTHDSILAGLVGLNRR